MLEPLDSLDPVDWAVWGDFLSDRGDEVGGERARCIGRGLERTGGLLYLYYQHITEFPQLSHVCCGLRSPISPDLNYNWTWTELEKKDWRGRNKVSPLHSLDLYEHRQDVVLLYWDKLAELGT